MIIEWDAGGWHTATRHRQGGRHRRVRAAASLPDGARVLTAEGEFASLLFPFLAHARRGVTVEELALEQLPDLQGPADLVAVSAVQSSDGRAGGPPAWFSWAGAAESLELLAALGTEAVQAHDVGLANAFRDRVGRPPSDSAG